MLRFPAPAAAIRLVLAATTIVACLALAPAARAGVDFATEIRPIFQQHCYECHGPRKNEGDLRLTNRADAFAPGQLGIPVLSPGSAKHSPLFDLVTSSDPAERMPKERTPLSPREIDLLRRWIDEGASWPDGVDAPHWAYVKPVRAPLPQVRHQGWARSDLDLFVLARLEREGIEPAPVADPSTLLRRVHLDLTGLPPTLAEQEEFLRDPSPEAYDRVVDRLLASRSFGERWATEWLDLAHYADSTGFMSEVGLSNWAYRDWVIDAIDDDMPFDRFTVEQLAGDLLPNATIEQQVATGFLRSVPLNLEAGVREEDARVAQVIDRVNTVGTTWLGTTVACAQCHDHKYDPLSQVEYYRLLAFLDSTVKEAVSADGAGGVLLVPRGPMIRLRQSETTRAQAVALAETLLDDIDDGLLRSNPGARRLSSDERMLVLGQAREAGGQQAVARASAVLIDRLRLERGEDWWKPWLDDVKKHFRDGAPHWKTLPIAKFEGRVNGTAVEHTYRTLDDGSVLVEGAPPERGTYVVELRDVPPGATALRIETLRDPSLPGGGPGRGRGKVPKAFVISEIVVTELASEGERPIEISGTIASARSGGSSPALVLDQDVDTGWSYADKALDADQWITLVPAVDFPITGKPLRIDLHQLSGEGRMVGRLRVSATTDGRDVVQMPPAFASRIVAQPLEQLSAADLSILQTLARQTLLPPLLGAFDRAQRKVRTLEESPRAHVVKEEATPRTTHVFERGDHRTPGAVVTPGTPAMLPAMREGMPRNRLGLAQWLVDRDNPLTARVVVNRWWAHLLGRGLVTTPEDFGIRGEAPSHPELLDWLAVTFVESGWSRKAVLRAIVTSQTYRQGAVPADLATLERDPDNRLLARNPPRRLPAESIRDNALQIAGLLSPKRGGPAVFPPQPPGVWRSNGHTPARYTPSDGDDVYRRGVYTVWRRTTPYPSFVNFDAVDRTACVARRSSSNTPLQALTLLNDEVYVEAALAFAQRVLRELPRGSSQERLTRAVRLALARDPTAAESAVLAKLLDSRLAWARKAPDQAGVLLEANARFAPSPDVDRSELVAWFEVARVILNLDETIHSG